MAAASQPLIINVAVVGSMKTEAGVTMYLCTCTDAAGAHWQVSRRYSEFEALRTLLIQAAGYGGTTDGLAMEAIPFPPKYGLTLIQSEETTSQKRVPLLKAWFEAVLAQPLFLTKHSPDGIKCLQSFLSQNVYHDVN